MVHTTRGQVGRTLSLLLAVLTAGALATASAQGGKFISVDDDPVLGDPTARVTIIEFGDYQCPYCRIFWKDTFPRLKKEYIDTGKVRFVFRDFPQKGHPEAIAAAMAAECAEDQGRYWPFHDKLFREQDRRGQPDEVVQFRNAELKRWATDVGLEAAAFNECLDTGRHKDEVMKDYEDAAGLGMKGTPVFFVNGRALLGAHPFATFQKVIEAELSR
jgi:protein-disulfide isomerase